jgi:hypothetical protein
MGDDKPAINLGTAAAAVFLTTVLAAEQEALVAVPDKRPSAHAPANTHSVALHLDYRMPSNDMTAPLTGQRMAITAGMLQPVSEPASVVFPAVAGI